MAWRLDKGGRTSGALKLTTGKSYGSFPFERFNNWLTHFTISVAVAGFPNLMLLGGMKHIFPLPYSLTALMRNVGLCITYFHRTKHLLPWKLDPMY